MSFCWRMGWFDGSFLADALYLHVLVLTCLLLVNTATNTNILQTLQTDFCSSQLDHIRSNDGLRFWNGGGQVLPRIRQTRHETHVNTDEVRWLQDSAELGMKTARFRMGSYINSKHIWTCPVFPFFRLYPLWHCIEGWFKAFLRLEWVCDLRMCKKYMFSSHLDLASEPALAKQKLLPIGIVKTGHHCKHQDAIPTETALLKYGVLSR